MSESPRTDAVAADITARHDDGENAEWRMDEHARQLEREVAQLRAELAAQKAEHEAEVVKAKNGEWSKGFTAGRNSVTRKNDSGCCCKTDDDGNEIISLCMLHKDYFQAERDAAVAEALELRHLIKDIYAVSVVNGDDLFRPSLMNRMTAAIRALKPRSDMVCVPSGRIEALTRALETIRDECFSGNAYDIAVRALAAVDVQGKSICPKCGVNRLEEGCPRKDYSIECPMVGQAAAEADK